MIDDDVTSCDHHVIPPQMVDKGDSVDVKYTGWLFENGIGKVRMSLHHDDVILMTLFCLRNLTAMLTLIVASNSNWVKAKSSRYVGESSSSI